MQSPHCTCFRWGTGRVTSATNKAVRRFPDILSDRAKVIGEVKDVAYQYLSSQMKDDIAYAADKGYTFILYVREGAGTTLSSSLRSLEETGAIIVNRVIK